MRRTLAGAAIDLIVLDIMMPGEDGLSLCRMVRETTETPVILLTAMVEETDRVVGLEQAGGWIVAQLEGPLGRDMALRVPYALAAAGSALIAIYGWMRLRFAAVAAT